MNTGKHQHRISIDEVERIIQDLEDNVISDKDLRLLKEMIKNEPEVRKLYFRHMELVALLKRRVIIREESGMIPVSDVVIEIQKRKIAVMSLVAGMAAILILSLVFYLFHVNQDQVKEFNWVIIEQSDDALCTATSADGEIRQEGRLLSGDQIRLNQGLVRILFPSGVEAVIEGPSELKLISDSSIKMHGGAAWLRVPKGGNGFTVVTDRANVIDLGTEFGLRFDANDQLQVHVAKGRVRVEPTLSAMKPIELKQNLAMTFDVYGGGESIKAEPSLFRRWFTDSIPYLHWSFDTMVDGHSPATGTIPGYEGYGTRLKHLQNAQAQIKSSDYQTEGKLGLALSLNGDGVFAISAFAGISGNAPRTVTAWIRHRKNSPTKRLSPYCAWGTRKTGKLWKISITDDRRLHTALMATPFTTSQSVSDRQEEWIHIAVVYTGKQNEQGNPDIRHFINGVKKPMLTGQSGRKVMTDTFSKSAHSVRFGATLNPLRFCRSVDGDIDEVFIFRGVLTELQIQQLMNQNRLEFFQH